MAKTGIKVTIKNIRGEYKPLNIFQYFNDGIRKRLPKMLASEFRDEILHNIDKNVFGFQLSEKWLEYKRRIGADARPYLMFEYYKNAISIITSEGHLAVGFKKSTMHPRAKISMGRLAIALEYGDLAKGRPARPIWRSTARKFFRERKGDVGKLIKKALESRNNVSKG